MGGGSLFDEAAQPIETTTTESSEAEPISPELRAFKNFFKTDIRIKRELLDLAPSPTDSYDEASRMDYAETAFRSFRDFRHDFLGIARDFGFGEYIEQSTENFFQRGQEAFAIGDYRADITQQLYRKAFANLRPDFVEEVKKENVGYTIFRHDLSRLITDATTINELLHAYHSHIMSDEHILRAVPALAAKENAVGYQITLRGDQSPLGQQIFDAIPDDLDVGATDIISADNHIMMMVRDRGHVLTISGEPDAEDPSKIWVEYNIPKLCNEDMIKALPGLAGYTPNGARGSFVISQDELGASLVNFIGKVPMDSDMPSLQQYLHPNQ